MTDRIITSGIYREAFSLAKLGKTTIHY